MTQQSTLTDRPSEHDFEIYGKLWHYLSQKGLCTFTADTLRDCFKGPPDQYGVTPFDHAFPDPAHDVGAWIAKCKIARLIVDTERRVPSAVESNHHRKISVFRMHGLKDRWEQAQEMQR